MQSKQFYLLLMSQLSHRCITISQPSKSWMQLKARKLLELSIKFQFISVSHTLLTSSSILSFYQAHVVAFPIKEFSFCGSTCKELKIKKKFGTFHAIAALTTWKSFKRKKKLQTEVDGSIHQAPTKGIQITQSHCLLNPSTRSHNWPVMGNALGFR